MINIYENYGVKIYNQDCVEGMKNLKDVSVDVSFTSPPYNRIRNDKYKFHNDDSKNYLDLLVDSTNEALRVTKGYVIVNLQQNHFNKSEYFRYLGMYHDKINGIITWEKTNPQPSRNYRETTDDYSITNATEVFILLKDGKEFRANTPIKNILSTSVNSERFENHGAVMKRSVAEFFIENFTREGDTVLDYFHGMGTTAVVCNNLNRKYVGFELHEQYFNKPIERIESELHRLV